MDRILRRARLFRPGDDGPAVRAHRPVSIILIAVKPELLAPSNMLDAPLSAYFAFLSIFSVIALVVAALWRAALKIRYEIWHLSHIALALTAVIAGVVHMVGSGFYLVDPWKRALWIGLTIFWIAAPAIPHRGSAQGTRRHYDAGDGAGWPPRLPLPPGPVRLADAVGKPLQDYRAPVFIFVQRRRRG
jgi:hypothetical protein